MLHKLRRYSVEGSAQLSSSVAASCLLSGTPNRENFVRMSKLNGRWNLQESINYEAYLRATGFSDEAVDKFLPLLEATGPRGLTEWYVVTSTTIQRTLYNDRTLIKKSPEIPLDAELEGVAIGDRPIKIFVTAVKPDRVEETETGENYKASVIREVAGNTLLVSLKTESGVESTRRYSKFGVCGNAD